MGYALKGDRVVRLLVSHLEDIPVVLNVEHMEKAECKMFRRS